MQNLKSMFSFFIRERTLTISFTRLLTLVIAFTVLTTSLVFAKPAANIEIESGKNQVKVVGEELNPLEVKVIDEDGNPPTDLNDDPLPVTVTFEVTKGGGNFGFKDGIESRPKVKVLKETNGAGIASATYTLGHIAGSFEENFLNNEVIATIDTPKGKQSVRFRLGAVPGSADKIEIASGNNQTGMITSVLSEALTVVVKDSFDNPVVGQTVETNDVNKIVEDGTVIAEPTTVTFTADGGATIIGGNATLDVKTDDYGRASVAVRLGPEKKDYKVTASAPGGGEKEFTAHAILPPVLPFQLKVNSPTPDEQPVIDTPGARLSNPFKVEVLSKEGKPVPGWDVIFKITKGNGTLPGGVTETVVSTDNDGMASIVLTLGTIPDPVHQWLNEVSATIIKFDENGQLAEDDDVVFFQAQASAPSDITAINGDKQTGKVGEKLDNPLTVQIQNEFEEPISKVRVVFEVLDGGTLSGDGITGASQLEVETGDDGKASVEFKLGTKVDAQYTVKATATLWDLDQSTWVDKSVTFIAEAEPGSAHKITKVMGDNQTEIAGSTLPDLFTVEIRDKYDNRLRSGTVKYLAATKIIPVEDGTVEKGEPVGTAGIGRNGRAAIPFRLGEDAQEYKVEAYVDGKIFSFQKSDDFQIPDFQDYFDDKITEKNEIYEELRNELRSQFVDNGFELSSDFSNSWLVKGSLWLIEEDGEVAYLVEKDGTDLNVYLNVEFTATAVPGPLAILKKDPDTDGLKRKTGESIKLKIEVTDTYENKITGRAGIPVTFFVVDGDGSFAPPTEKPEESKEVEVGDNGIASVTLYLGNVTTKIDAVTYTEQGNVEIKLSDKDHSPFEEYVIKEELTITPIIDEEENPDQPVNGAVGPNEEFACRISTGVKVTKEKEIQVAAEENAKDVEVKFSVEPSEKAEIIGNDTLLTDSNGEAVVDVKLLKKGEVKVIARLPAANVNEVLKLKGVDEGPDAINIPDAGDISDTTVVKKTVTPKVEVLDQYEHPMISVPVTFTIAKGDGSFKGEGDSISADKSTNNKGQASIDYILGEEAGFTHQIEASVTLRTNPTGPAEVTFGTESTPGKIDVVDIRGGNKQEDGTVVTTLDRKLIVYAGDKYFDEDGNPAAGRWIRFKVKRVPEVKEKNQKWEYYGTLDPIDGAVEGTYRYPYKDEPHDSEKYAKRHQVIDVKVGNGGLAEVRFTLGETAWTSIDATNPDFITDKVEVTPAPNNGTDTAETVTFEETAGPEAPDSIDLVKLDEDGNEINSKKLKADGGISSVKLKITVQDEYDNPTSEDKSGVTGVKMETAEDTEFRDEVVAGDLGTVPSIAQPRDKKDENGNPIPNGIYVADYNTGSFTDPRVLADKIIIKAISIDSAGNNNTDENGGILDDTEKVILTDVKLKVKIDDSKLVANGSDKTKIDIYVTDIITHEARTNELVVINPVAKGTLTSVIPKGIHEEDPDGNPDSGDEIAYGWYQTTYNTPSHVEKDTDVKIDVVVKNGMNETESITISNDPFDEIEDTITVERKGQIAIEITADQTTLTANGTDETTLTITVKDKDSELPVSSKPTITISPENGGTTKDLKETETKGTYTATYTAGTVAEEVTITATTEGVSEEITISLSPDDEIAPTFQSVDDISANAGNPVTVTARIADSAGVASATLYYKIGGKAKWKSVDMNKTKEEDAPKLDDWTGTTKADVTIAGLAYYIEAKDIAENSSTYGSSDEPVNVPVTGSITARRYSAKSPYAKYIAPPVEQDNPQENPASTGTFKALTWYMVSVPVEPEQTVDTIFGDWFTAVTWDPVDEWDAPLANANALFVMESSDKSSFSISGTSRDITEKHSIQLMPGWNIAGNPFSFGRYWDDDTISVRKNGVELPISEASSQGWVYHTIWWANQNGPDNDIGGSFYDAASSDPNVPNQAWKVDGDNNTQFPTALGPFSGFFVLAFEECELLISPMSHGPDDTPEVPTAPKVESYEPMAVLDVTPPMLPTVSKPQEVSSTGVHQNFPNPFNPETWIPYQLDNDANVTIKIFDMKGQLVRTLALANKPAGFYLTKEKAAHWDGRNNTGEKVASGLYFYQLKAGDFKSPMVKMVILK